MFEVNYNHASSSPYLATTRESVVCVCIFRGRDGLFAINRVRRAGLFELAEPPRRSVDSEDGRKGRYVAIRGGFARRERRRASEVAGARRASLSTAGMGA